MFNLFSANAFNLVTFKILSFGKGINNKIEFQMTHKSHFMYLQTEFVFDIISGFYIHKGEGS